MKNLASGEFWRLLRQVSRSFYLTLRVLPASVRPQMALAYLMARAADTLADAPGAGLQTRLAALGALREAIGEACRGAASGASAAWECGGAPPAERRLLQCVPQLLASLRGLPEQDRAHTGAVLGIIIGGQERDLLQFGSPGADGISALRSAAELDDYTYRVAGCVGEFWTRLCRIHVFPPTLDCAALEELGIRFGKGLQLVNILRDLPKDLRQGRCYLPEAQLREHSLSPPDLRDPAAIERLRPLYDGYLERAEQHLRAGWAYTNALPSSLVRLRLACAWPVLIGMRTLALLRAGNPLDGGAPIRVARMEVYGLIARSLLRYPRPAAWQRLVAP